MRSVAFGKYHTGPRLPEPSSSITAPNERIDTHEVFLPTVNAFAREHADKKIVLMGCGDNYVALIAQAKDKGELEGNIVAPYGPFEQIL